MSDQFWRPPETCSLAVVVVFICAEHIVDSIAFADVLCVVKCNSSQFYTWFDIAKSSINNNITPGAGDANAYPIARATCWGSCRDIGWNNAGRRAGCSLPVPLFAQSPKGQSRLWNTATTGRPTTSIWSV